jgi:hypothetical protein
MTYIDAANGYTEVHITALIITVYLCVMSRLNIWRDNKQVANDNRRTKKSSNQKQNSRLWKMIPNPLEAKHGL